MQCDAGDRMRCVLSKMLSRALCGCAGRELEERAERDTPREHTFVPWVTIDGRSVGAECGARPRRQPLCLHDRLSR